MPTAARLFAAVFLAIAAMMATTVAQVFQPEAAKGGEDLFWYMGAVGLVIGWLSLGRRVMDPETSYFGNGVAATVAVFIYGIVFMALYEVGDNMRFHLYREPMDAVLAAVNRFMEYSATALDIRVVLAAFTGAILAAYFARFVGYFWR
ncbi:MAG: TrgA family protein [Pseudomonadota bacterium]